MTLLKSNHPADPVSYTHLSMLGARDNEQHSYLEIVDAIRQYGAAPRQDLRQLWQDVYKRQVKFYLVDRGIYSLPGYSGLSLHEALIQMADDEALRYLYNQFGILKTKFLSLIHI